MAQRTEFKYPAIRAAVLTAVHDELRADPDFATGAIANNPDFGLDKLPAVPSGELRWQDFAACFHRRGNTQNFGIWQPLASGQPDPRRRSAKLLPIRQPITYSIVIPTLKAADGSTDWAATDELVAAIEQRITQLAFNYSLSNDNGVDSDIYPLSADHSAEQDGFVVGRDVPESRRIAIRGQWVLKYETEGC